MTASCPQCRTELDPGRNVSSSDTCPSCGANLCAVSGPGPLDTADVSLDRVTETIAHIQTPGLNPNRQICNGDRFGDYELLEELGRGGMGVVYKARQVSLNRIVALKTIKSGELADEEEIERFYKEAEAAANLDHPGIVPVYEVGEADGRHYFSMGYVEGKSLASHCANGPLPAHQAADWVRQLAEAMDYAHEHGVIHRDLKPGNVLMNAKAKPRISDFGLAKRLAGDSELTAFGQILGTPSYMPPEQARGDLDAGASADIYALGAILYCCLTGRPPFQAATVVETLRQVTEREVVSPRHLNAAIDRDLETICLKCLEKTPKRRYDSAAELSSELRRFLEGRPILARPISSADRFRRWARRNPLPTALGATIVFSLIAGTIVSLSFARIADSRAGEASRAATTARKERDLADTARKKANEALTETRQTINSFVDTAQNADLLKEKRFNSLLRELLADALEHYERFIDQHQHDDQQISELAEAVSRVAQINARSGDNDQAIRALRRAVEIWQRLQKEHPRDWTYLNNLAREYHNLAGVLQSTGDLTLATEMFEKSLKIRRQLVQENPRAVHKSGLAKTCLLLGTVYENSGKPRDAAEYIQQAVDILKGLVEKHSESEDHAFLLASGYDRLGRHFRTLGRPSKAIDMFSQSIEIRQRLYQRDPRNTKHASGLAGSYYSLGLFYRLQGELSEASGMYVKVIEILGPLVRDNPNVRSYAVRLANCYNNLGVVNEISETLGEAIDAYGKSIEVMQQLHRENPTVAEYMSGLANIYHNLGSVHSTNEQPDEAIEMYRKSIDLLERLVDKNPIVIDYAIDLAKSYGNLGNVYMHDKPGLSKEMHRQAIEVQVPFVQENSRNESLLIGLAGSYVNLALAMRSERELEPELKLYEKAESLLRSVLERNSQNATARLFLANCLKNRSVAYGTAAWKLATHTNAKERDGEQAVAYATKACESTNWKQVDLLTILAAAYAEFGDFEMAVNWQKEAIKLASDSKNTTLTDRLKRFRAGKPLRDASLASTDKND